MKQALIYDLKLKFQESNTFEESILEEIKRLRDESFYIFSDYHEYRIGERIISLYFKFAIRKNLMAFLKNLYFISNSLGIKMVPSNPTL